MKMKRGNRYNVGRKGTVHLVTVDVQFFIPGMNFIFGDTKIEKVIFRI